MAGNKIIVESNIKKLFQERKLQVGSGTYSRIEEEIKKVINKAADRTENNRRHTVLPRDI